ncbi:P-loop NTPase [Ruminiclostridium papyrosolvens]|uniref:ATP synthase n=1 Tax=Ruminiclostridium papyrosolvens C7 TaxID=1330534 RepID=U4R5V8_9FIRM|nr:P-loop NTPase [Ruminiclostridium papyrosolvens]EPR13974.1 ATP synthase [Ruminiclostridium papyrosolvens C7]
MFDKRINIFTGHFGSGKTEVAVNYAMKMAEAGYRTAIVDFDIINPYFRTADAKDALEEQNIKVILPMYANTNVDIPAIPPEIYSLFEDKNTKVVLDVGGDDLGAKAVSRFKEEIVSDDYEMFFVVNTKRIMTDSPEKIAEMIAIIEDGANIKVTKLVNNSNLLEETTPEIILEGNHIISQVSEKTGIPIAITAGMEEVINKIQKSEIGKTEILSMRKQIHLPWNRG